MPIAKPLDCKTCGACCLGSGGDYVPVTALDRRRLPTKYKNKLQALSKMEDGALQALPLKRFGENKACVALKGKLGKDISCDIYAHRPEFCRTFEKGGSECLARRAEVFHIVQGSSE